MLYVTLGFINVIDIVDLMLLISAKDFPTVQKRVAELIKGRILVGHALRNDLKVSGLI